MASAIDTDKFLDLQEIGVDVDEDTDPLTSAFNKAANHLQIILPRVDNQTLLTLYGYYKQGSEGPCNTSKPSWYDIRAKAKWEAWNRLENMPKDQAKTLYINAIKAIDPTFDGVENLGNGNKVSSMAGHNAIPYNEMSLVDHVKNGHVDEVKMCLKEYKNIRKILNKLDDCGLGLIHWAADSGHERLLEVLLEAGANINQIDVEGQTPLHYAANCGHFNCVKFLLDNGAKTDVADNDGSIPFEVAADDEIKELLK